MKGEYIRTFTGRQFWPLDPRPELVDIRDIAHALSCIGRFNGHARQFYSVAEHCCYMHDLFSPDFGYQPIVERLALLHDGAEAYLCDMVAPVKRSSNLGELFAKAEEAIEAAVFEALGLHGTNEYQRKLVAVADKALCHAEKMMLTESPRGSGHYLEEVMKTVAKGYVEFDRTFVARLVRVPFCCWAPDYAESEFLRRWGGRMQKVNRVGVGY